MAKEEKTMKKSAEKVASVMTDKTKDLTKGSLKVAKRGLSGFWAFFKEQNIVGLAIGLVLGTHAGTLVKSLIDNVFMPPLGLLLGSADGIRGLSISLGTTPTGEAAVLSYGIFLNDLINFVILAFCIYVVVKLLKLDIKK